ncbi:hypothetical protein D3C71_1225780 [compost metagenome]
MLTQSRHVLRHTVLLQIGRAGEDAQAAVRQRPRMQGGIGQRADADGDIGAAFEQVDVALAAVELQRDVRVARAVTGDQGRDHMQHERHGRIHAQPARRPFTARGDLLLGRFHRGDDGARLLQEGFALLGQVQAPGGAGQQGGAQLLFQPRQRPADARGGLLQLLGGGGD